MLAREIMTRPVLTLKPGDSIRRAIRVLYAGNITAAPVVDEHGGLVGIVSEVDLLCGEYQADPRARVRPATVEEVMTRDVWAVGEMTDAAVVIELMVREPGQERSRAPRRRRRRHRQPA